jgi:hypothetical protein
MKRLVVLFLGMCVIVALFAGCDPNPNPHSKMLVVFNDSAAAIEVMEIREFVTQGSRVFGIVNALAPGTTIPVGGNMRFYLAPYTSSEKTYSSSGYTRLYIEGVYAMFKFNYSLNENIYADFKGETILLRGSGVELEPLS